MGKIDDFSNKWLSRKLTVFIIATIALFLNKISGVEWVYIAFIYIVMQGLVDAKILFEYFKNK